MLRLTVAGLLDEDQAPAGLKSALAKAGGADDFDGVKRRMQATADDVFAIFKRFIADPARRASDGSVRTHEGSVQRNATSEEELKP
jgi:hypothetical protein